MFKIMLLALAGILSACAETQVSTTVSPVTGEETSDGRVRLKAAKSNPPSTITIGGEREENSKGK